MRSIISLTITHTGNYSQSTCTYKLRVQVSISNHNLIMMSQITMEKTLFSANIHCKMYPESRETNWMKACSRNQHQVIIPSWLPKVPSWLRKNVPPPYLSQAFSYFAPYISFTNCTPPIPVQLPSWNCATRVPIANMRVWMGGGGGGGGCV